jgi:hypothetical protein
MGQGTAFPNRYSIEDAMRSRTMSPVIPPVVAICPMISLSQQSMAKAIRILCALKQRTSKMSEHQRMLLAG